MGACGEVAVSTSNESESGSARLKTYSAVSGSYERQIDRGAVYEGCETVWLVEIGGPNHGRLRYLDDVEGVKMTLV